MPAPNFTCYYAIAKDWVWSDSPRVCIYVVCVECDDIDRNPYVAPGSPTSQRLHMSLFALLPTTSIVLLQLCSALIFQAIKKYNVITAPSTDIAFEPKTFIDHFLP